MEIDKSQIKFAEFSILPQPSTCISRLDNKTHRFYWWQELVGDKMVVKTGIGITSLLSMVMPESKPLTDWKVRTDGWQDILAASSEYGTMMHGILQKWLTERSVPKEMLDAAREPCIRVGMNRDMPERDLLSWALFCEEYDLKPILIEAMLISEPIDGEQYCQAVDLLCDIGIPETITETIEDGVYKSGPRKGATKYVEKKTTTVSRKIASIDWKANFMSKDAKQFFASHKFQLIAAKRSVEYNYPEIHVDLLINWSPSAWRTKVGYEMKTWNITQQDQDMFDAYINIARIGGLFRPTGSIFVAPEFTPNTTSSDFKLLSYEEYVEQKLIVGQQVTVDELADEDYVDETSPILNNTK